MLCPVCQRSSSECGHKEEDWAKVTSWRLIQLVKEEMKSPQKEMAKLDLIKDCLEQFNVLRVYYRLFLEEEYQEEAKILFGSVFKELIEMFVNFSNELEKWLLQDNPLVNMKELAQAVKNSADECAKLVTDNLQFRSDYAPHVANQAERISRYITKISEHL